MTTTETAVGRAGFIAAHDLWDDERRETATRALATVREQQLRQIRVVTADPHGKTRGKVVVPSTFSGALANGLDFVTALFHFDSADGIVYDPFTRGGGLDLDTFTGFPDAVLVPDPRTFRVLPWAPDTGWVLGDMYLGDGTPVPFDWRHVLRRALSALADAGFSYLAGLEVELSITRLVDPARRIEALGGPGTPPDPPLVEALGGGYAYQAEDHLDQAHEIVSRLAELLPAVGLPLRSIEDEWGPGQFEVTFDPLGGLDAADAMVLFRGAVKQICRLGLHATFMCRPGLPGFFASGWHPHQSLLTPDGANAFVADDAVLSGWGAASSPAVRGHRPPAAARVPRRRRVRAQARRVLPARVRRPVRRLVRRSQGVRGRPLHRGRARRSGGPGHRHGLGAPRVLHPVLM